MLSAVQFSSSPVCNKHDPHLVFCKGHSSRDYEMGYGMVYWCMLTPLQNKNCHNIFFIKLPQVHPKAVVAEWLRRWTRNPLGSARAGSNPADCACFVHKFPILRLRPVIMAAFQRRVLIVTQYQTYNGL